MLLDPVRAQIFFEIMLQKEITANQLMNRLTINRSTLTHHLTKMVETGLLDVRIQSTGRPIKYYSLSKEQKQKIIINTKINRDIGPEEKLRNKINYLETIIAYVQVVNNSVQKVTKQLANNLILLSQSNDDLDKETIDPYQLLNFSFRLVSDDGAKEWNKRFERFHKESLKEISKSETDMVGEPKHIVFSGIVPLIRRE